MKSGLEGRNNKQWTPLEYRPSCSLNEVRPRRPEQSASEPSRPADAKAVSMKSGLEGRNNGRAE